MEQVNIIGIDLAKRSFQLHGARADGSVAFRRKVSREKFLYFLAALPRCVVAMEACASAHHWGREIMQLGHDVRLVPPIYVKPFVKRQKNDAADAEAICEAAQRPTMRFVAVKGEEQQARAMLFHTRDLLVRQRTQTINALRGHLAEFGVVAPQGVAHVGRLALALEDPGSGLPEPVRELGGVLLGQIAHLDAKIGGLEKELRACARQDEQAARLMTIPGIGPIGAMALQAFAPPMESFRRGRDFSAWLGLVPRQHTTGGKSRLGRISKMGQRDLRRLLIIGAMAVVSSAVRRGETNDPWLARMLARKSRMLVAVALVGNDRKFPICNDPKFLTLGLSLKAYRTVLLALPTERDRCADVQMGDQDVVEALSGPGRLEGGAVEAVRGEPSDDPQLGRYRPTGPGSGRRCARVFAPSAGGPQAGPLQGNHRRPS